MVRTDIEGRTIAPFKREAMKLGLPTSSGMGAANKIHFVGQVGFQFGDLRDDVGKHWVIIEAESASGVTNLAKDWYMLDNLWDAVGKPIRLLHLFRVDSVGDRLIPSRHTYTSRAGVYRRSVQVGDWLTGIRMTTLLELLSSLNRKERRLKLMAGEAKTDFILSTLNQASS